MRWLNHVLGIDNASGPWYLFWSGPGSDLAYLTVFAGAWHHLNCHEQGCWRPGRHVTTGPDGVHVRRCARHHRQPSPQPKEQP